MTGTTRPGRAGIARCEIWSTDRMPVDNSDEAAVAQREGFVNLDFSNVPCFRSLNEVCAA
jgi:hypothetical protein